jgi:SAM-dependent methyltransferase
VTATTRLDESTAVELDESDLYTYGLRLGAHCLVDRRWKRGLKFLVQPIPYWRSLEYRLVWNNAGFNREDRVLDIGSPKLLSIYLAERVQAEVFSTDIDPYFIDDYQSLRRMRKIPADRFQVEVQDGRKLTYPDNSFSKVYAISVIEHIPDEGDAECLKEIGRVLRPGGTCLITVPFWPTSKEEYRAPNFYWVGASTTRADGRVFFQRRYSLRDLHERLIRPSQLTVKTMRFVGERVMTHSTREFCQLLTPFTAPLDPLVSRVVHTEAVESPERLKKPLCAFLALTKT